MLVIAEAYRNLFIPDIKTPSNSIKTIYYLLNNSFSVLHVLSSRVVPLVFGKGLDYVVSCSPRQLWVFSMSLQLSYYYVFARVE